jgi:hypothetical protein
MRDAYARAVKKAKEKGDYSSVKELLGYLASNDLSN